MSDYLSISFNVHGEQQYARRFQLLADEGKNLREPLSRIRDRLIKSTGEQFLSEGSHGGTPWDPLSREYALWKDHHFPGRPLLVRTGAMREAFLVHGTRELTAKKLVWGVTDQVDHDGERIAVRAAAHQTGRGVVPQRKIIALTLEDRRAFDREFVQWFNHAKNSIFQRVA